MMDNQEVISLYESVSDITAQMLTAARAGDWDQLSALETRCAGHVETLRQREPGSVLPADARQKKVRIIQKILADDREIRNITEPWMAQLSVLMNSSGTERKLSKAYGASYSG